jgi:hypothetical protein
MSGDRRIELHVSVPQFKGHEQASDSQGKSAQGDADPQARQRFEEAMQGKDQTPVPTPATPDSPAPFSLFAGVASAAASPASGSRSSELHQKLDDTLSSLLVEEGTGGSRQVRMELKEEVLPGTTVVVQEAEGRLQIQFICSQEDSRLRLNRIAPEQAQALAHRLNREVLISVVTDDDEDPCLFETVAIP